MFSNVFAALQGWMFELTNQVERLQEQIDGLAHNSQAGLELMKVNSRKRNFNRFIVTHDKM